MQRVKIISPLRLLNNNGLPSGAEDVKLNVIKILSMVMLLRITTLSATEYGKLGFRVTRWS